MRGQHELDRQLEQRAEASDDVVAYDVLAAAEPDVESVAKVGERVAADDRVDRGDAAVGLLSTVKRDDVQWSVVRPWLADVEAAEAACRSSGARTARR